MLRIVSLRQQPRSRAQIRRSPWVRGRRRGSSSYRLCNVTSGVALVQRTERIYTRSPSVRADAARPLSCTRRPLVQYNAITSLNGHPKQMETGLIVVFSTQASVQEHAQTATKRPNQYGGRNWKKENDSTDCVRTQVPYSRTSVQYMK